MRKCLFIAIILIFTIIFVACENPFWNVPDKIASDKKELLDPVITWPEGITANLWLEHVKNTQSVPRKLSDVPLTLFTNDNTGAFAWVEPDTELDKLGLQSYSMIFTPDDGNYKTVTNDVEIRVLLGVEMVEVSVPVGVAFQIGKHLGTASGSDITNFHDVTFTRNFSMSKYQVTQEQYEAVIGTNPSYFHGGTGREPATGEVQEKRPVETVRWYESIVFCNRLSALEGLTPAYSIDGETDPDIWISTHGAVPTSWIPASRWNFVEIVDDSTGYRLPTDAQWEYAAKGGMSSSLEGYSYSGSNNPNEVAWYSGKTGTPTASRTHEVGLLKANELGLFDMSGNVYEWCWDWWGSYTDTAKTDPTGASSGAYRVMRGGGWNNSATGVRSVNRNYVSPNSRNYSFGFRLLRP